MNNINCLLLAKDNASICVIRSYYLHFPTGLKVNQKINKVGKIGGEITSFRLKSRLLLFPAYVSHCKTSKHGPEHLTCSPKEVLNISLQARQHRNKQLSSANVLSGLQM